MISKIIKNRLLSSVIIAVAVFILLSALFRADIFQGWNYRLTDSLYTEKKPLENIVIIAIDDKSLQEIGRWPWPRENFVKLLPMLNKSAVVGIDVAFFEPYKHDADESLGIEISRLNTVIPLEFVDFEKKDGRLYGKSILKSIPELENRAEAGFINIITDSDGITRNAPLTIKTEQQDYPSFALKIVQKYLGKNASYGFENLIINFIGKQGSFRTVSFSDVLSNKTGIDFGGKIVLIGATAPDLHDDSITPTSEGKPMPGVEIHANSIQTLLTKNFLARQGDFGVILIILALAILTAAALSYFRFVTATVLSAVLFVLYLLASIYVFDKGLILNLVYPFLSVILTYGGVTIFFYFSEGRERKRIRSIFNKYVSKDVVDEILKKTEKDEIDLKGEIRDVTILFSDIRGFTSMSEKMKPHDVVTMLNKYLGSLTEVVFRNKGTLDKYIGDCIMAIFGAPIEDSEHDLNAIKAGIGMRDKIVAMQKGRAKKVGMGIGIHSGEAVIGNMGSKERVDYTAIGDNVNLASRLCSNAKAGEVLISEETYNRVKDKVKVKDLGEIKVKGKEMAVKIYDVVGLK